MSAEPSISDGGITKICDEGDVILALAPYGESAQKKRQRQWKADSPLQGTGNGGVLAGQKCTGRQADDVGLSRSVLTRYSLQAFRQ